MSVVAAPRGCRRTGSIPGDGDLHRRDRPGPERAQVHPARAGRLRRPLLRHTRRLDASTRSLRAGGARRRPAGPRSGGGAGCRTPRPLLAPAGSPWKQLAPAARQRIHDPQAREAPEAVVVRRQDEPVLDRERGDLHVGHVVAAQARRLGQLGGDRPCPAPAVTSRTAGCSRKAVATPQPSRTGTARPPTILALVIRRTNAYTTGQHSAMVPSPSARRASSHLRTAACSGASANVA